MHKINHFVELDVKEGIIEVVASIIVKSFPINFTTWPQQRNLGPTHQYFDFKKSN